MKPKRDRNAETEVRKPPVQCDPEGWALNLKCFPFSFQKWASFVRFSHTVFALPFALAAMLVAARDNRGWPGWKTFGLILAAMVCARTCAMAFNRIVDRKFDALNPRTKNRHLPAGQISLFSAISLCVLSAAGLIAASYFLNPLCFYLSPVALVLVCFYSLTKRFTDYTHVFLGLALALAPVGAWLAVKGGNVSAGNFADDHARVRRGFVARRLRHHLRVARLRVRQIARAALARRGVGAEERAGRRVSRAHGHVRRCCSASGCCAGSASRISSAGSSSSAASCWNTGSRAAAA
jgi:hypothetical protein